ncbi:hypothetical protein BC828DRAFT_389280 [Blastocladiella britannica]|nr:hypothetical protein BC828DRAFT_389280 [Blastocladiella britannica]
MGCLFSTAKWKREEVPDHKFDFVDLDEFASDSCTDRVGYSTVYMLTFRAVLMYMSDISTAVLIGAFETWSVAGNDPNSVKNNLDNTEAFRSFTKTVGKVDMTKAFTYLRWIYVASILISFALLALDARKSQRIIRSRDISFAFTDVISYRYYCIRSFKYWCFFKEIRKHHSFSDQVALFVFFRLKGWTRLLFAETPRHTINLLFLSYQFWVTGLDPVSRNWTMKRAFDTQFRPKDSNGNLAANVGSQFSVVVMAFVAGMYLINLFSTVVAAIIYVPLLCRMRGNLKEYVCHLIDKRIGELMRRKAAKRIHKQNLEVAMFGITKEAALRGGPAAKLPVIGGDDDVTSAYGSVAPSAYGAASSPGLYATKPALSPGYPSHHPQYGGQGSSQQRAPSYSSAPPSPNYYPTASTAATPAAYSGRGPAPRVGGNGGAPVPPFAADEYRRGPAGASGLRQPLSPSSAAPSSSGRYAPSSRPQSPMYSNGGQYGEQQQQQFGQQQQQYGQQQQQQGQYGSGRQQAQGRYGSGY